MAVDMTGRVALITGATNGIGEITARELAKMGATTVIVGRSATKTQQVAEEIKSISGNANVDTIVADLSTLAGMRQTADDFRQRYDRLHVLVNNAGAIFTEKEITPDGFEKTFALNHLSYFVVTNLLLDLIQAAGTPERKARVISVSSSAHTFGEFDLERFDNGKNLSGMEAYGVSKLFNLYFAFELARLLQQQNAPVTSNAVHPGVVRTGFAKNNSNFSGQLAKFIVTFLLAPFALTPEQGAKTQIYVATAPELENVTGKYFAKSKIATSSPASLNQDNWKRLWQLSEQMTDQ